MGEGQGLHLAFDRAEKYSVSARITFTVTHGKQAIDVHEIAIKGTKRIEPLISKYEGWTEQFLKRGISSNAHYSSLKIL